MEKKYNTGTQIAAQTYYCFQFFLIKLFVFVISTGKDGVQEYWYKLSNRVVAVLYNL